MSWALQARAGAEQVGGGIKGERYWRVSRARAKRAEGVVKGDRSSRVRGEDSVSGEVSGHSADSEDELLGWDGNSE